jgi:predicted MFS family arabinose efflux permease
LAILNRSVQNNLRSEPLRVYIEPIGSIKEVPMESIPKLEDKIEKNTGRALIILSSAFFIQSTTALAIVGGFEGITKEWSLTSQEAAMLVAAFGATFAIGAPLFQVLIGHWIRRTQILTGLTIMAGGALIFAVAPNYEVLFLARVLMGLGAALISPILSALGSSLVKPHQQGAALAIVIMGYSIASVIGVPTASYLSMHLGARWLFGALALAILAVGLLIGILIRDRSPGENVSLKTLGQLLSRQASFGGLLVIFFITSGMFAIYTMITPIMHEIYHANSEMVSFALLVFGVSGFVGNIFVRQASARWSAEILLKTSMIILAVIYATLLVAPISLTLLIAALLIWPFVADVVWPSQQRRLVELETPYRGLVLALNSSFMFSGMAVGSALGGFVYTSFGFVAVLELSIGMIAMGLVSLAYSLRARASFERIHLLN